MQDHYLEPCGIAYRTNTFVPGRKTILFVHGLSGSAAAWVPYEQALRNTHNIVTFDLRGHGLSQRPATFEAYSLEYFVSDLEVLCNTLDLKNLHLVSHSFGTLIALEFIRKHADRVARVLLLSPVYGMHSLLLVRATQHLLGLYVWLAELFSAKPLELRRHTYTYNAHIGDWNIRRIIADIRTTGARPYLYALEHLYKESHDADWRELSLPTRILHGAKDTIVPVRNAHLLAKTIPKATLRVLPKSNHILPLNDVADVLEAIHVLVT